METSNRPCDRISRSLAFAATGKGEAWTRRSKGPKPLRRTPLSDSPARRERPPVLNPLNRRIRTRMSGGVGGAEPRGSPLSRFHGLHRHVLGQSGADVAGKPDDINGPRPASPAPSKNAMTGFAPSLDPICRCRACPVRIGLHLHVKSGRCDPGYDALAAELRMSRRSIFRLVAMLRRVTGPRGR